MLFEKSELEKCVIGEGLIEDDGHIHIRAHYTVLFDRSAFTLKKGFHGTPIMIYVVNTAIERIGTLSDEEIVLGMIQRGYIVTVLDYLGNEKASSPKLDKSVQGIRQRLMKGEFFAVIDGFGDGYYPETLVVPSGYDVSFGNVYWELDKHGADGTLEKIVEIWNNDFRGTNAEKMIKWTTAQGERKAVQSAHDGSAPVWYDANGNPDDLGEYIRIKHTLAAKIQDCVKSDGSPLDLKLYMHIVYPAKPTKKVPVMCLASSAEGLCAGSAEYNRPHMNGFLFNGYAGVLFDYAYTPMARKDHYGYFDGYPKAGYITGDNPTYSLKHYNDFSDTAAMRLIRYLALSDEKFCFDTEAIGVYGNSKGGWMTFLGEKDPDAMPSRRMFAGHHGETRYENGDTESCDGIHGGEKQPWLSYHGEKIFGGANFVYSSCGATHFSVSKGHCPMFVSCNRQDQSCYSTSNALVNLGRIYDIPTMWLEVPLGHTLVCGEDLLYSVDSYQAFFDFAGYCLKNDAVKVISAKVDRHHFPASVTVLFSGIVDDAEAARISVYREGGEKLAGKLTCGYGGVEWTFTPDEIVYGKYVLCVPESLKGGNGKTIQSKFAYDVDFGDGEAKLLTHTLEIEAKGDRRYLAFEVKNDAVNTVCAYTSKGERIGSAYVCGKGWYRIDVTKLDALTDEMPLIKSEKKAQVTQRSLQVTPCDSVNTEEVIIRNGEKAIAVNGFAPCTKYPTEEFYSYPANALICDDVIKSGALDETDLGRRFRISFRVYDTISRYISFGLNHCSSHASQIADYKRAICNEITSKDQWTEYSFDYIVHEPIFGDVGKQRKSFYFQCFGNGNADAPLYLTDLKCEETVTEVIFGETYVCYENGEEPLPFGQIKIECPKSPWSK